MTSEEEPVAALIARFRALAYPSRIAIMDALHAANGVVTEDELGRWVPEARRNLRTHLAALEKAGIIQRVAASDSWELQRTAPVEWTDDMVRGSSRLQRAVQEFERLLTQRRIDRMRQWAQERHHSWPSEWSDASTSTDYVLRMTVQEMEDLDARISAEIRRARDQARSREAAAEEETVFVTVSAFPLRLESS
ncbi:helix-turn-helix domain-containing protein [Rudaeicoccus suwonensis]|uniref:Helix-turn-helix protein n=1 Tax=Rudaeicoccus suwonensis TaxID=657409 RepID=A0A561DVJ0_9MICO|nr:helix-turn-helix domain-containing protein [Rudaeicoccus suwonensis]TWE07360.1 helix-turn-helix protein [Rudaeicoccus suwonensis]